MFALTNGISNFLITQNSHCAFYEESSQPHRYQYDRADKYYYRADDYLPDQIGFILRREAITSAVARMRRRHETPIKILDAGSNDGILTQFLLGARDSIMCLDISRRALVNASMLLSRPGLPSPRSLSLVQADVSLLPFPGDAFDIVVLGEVIEHLTSPLDCLRETHRVLKTGGIAYITTPNTLGLGLVYGKLKKFSEKAHLSLPEYRTRYRQEKQKQAVFGVRTHEHEYSTDEVANLLSSAGFKNPRMQTRYLTYLDFQFLSKGVRGFDRYFTSRRLVKWAAKIDDRTLRGLALSLGGFIQIWEVEK
jgi:ubiquinone/menaquinone biosynthesis C-methylase UbiE